MRRFSALTLVALLSTTLVLAAVGCGQKAEEPPATETTTEQPMMDTMADTAMADTATGH